MPTTDSQNDLNWYKSFQKTSLKTTFAQGLQKGPTPIPPNLGKRTPVQAPTLFSLSHPCPKRCPKGSQKRPQGTLKSTKNSNKTVLNKKPQIATDSLSCFWFPLTQRSRAAPQGTAKGTKNNSKRDLKCGREPTRRKDSPRTFPKAHLGFLGGARRCVFCKKLNSFCYFFCCLLQFSWLFNSFTSSFFCFLSSLVSLPFSPELFKIH